MDMGMHDHLAEVAQRIASGNLHAQHQDWQHAATDYRTALALDERSAEAANNLGVVLRVNSHGDEAIAMYLRALALNPALKVARRNLLESVLERTQEARELGDAVGARRWIAIGIAALGPERELLVARGDLCLADNSYDDAIASYAAILQGDRGDTDAWTRVGDTCHAAGDDRRASGAYLTALHAARDVAASSAVAREARLRRSRSAIACTDEGVAAMRAGHYAQAVLAFRRALQEDADYAPAAEYLEWASAANDA